MSAETRRDNYRQDMCQRSVVFYGIIQKQKDYETINFVGQLYLDGIVVEKDESKGNKYKKEAEDILDSSLNKLGKLCDKLFKDTKEN